MRSYFLFVLTMSLLSCDWSDWDQSHEISIQTQIPKVEISESDPHLSRSNDGMVYLDSIKLSGYMISYYSDSTMKSKRSFYMGRLEGDYFSFYPNGRVKSQRPYSQGEKHGEHLGYFEDGQLKFKYYFENGFGQGTHKEWYLNGELKSEMNYTDGRELGLQRVWRPDGKMRSNYVVRENGRKYGMLGLKRCAKIDSETGDVDPYKGSLK